MNMRNMSPIQYCIWRLSIHSDYQKKDSWGSQNATDEWNFLTALACAVGTFIGDGDYESLRQRYADYNDAMRELFAKQDGNNGQHNL